MLVDSGAPLEGLCAYKCALKEVYLSVMADGRQMQQQQRVRPASIWTFATAALCNRHNSNESVRNGFVDLNWLVRRSPADFVAAGEPLF